MAKKTKTKKNRNTLYHLRRIVLHVLYIIFNVCAFTLCAFVFIEYAIEHRIWPDGLAWLAACVIIVWQNIHDLRIYLKEKKSTTITLPADLGTPIYFIPAERDQVESGKIIGAAIINGKTYMILRRIDLHPTDFNLPRDFKIATDNTFFFTYEEANAHLNQLAELMPKITATEAAERISEISRKAGESLDDASRAQTRMVKAMKEAQGYAEN